MSGKCYKKNFIKQVIAKIDFATPVEIFSPSTIADAVIEIKKRFPISEQATAMQQDFQISNKGISTTKDEFPEWVFHGAERNKVLKVNKLFIEVLLTKYTSEDDFEADLVAPISQLLKINPNTIINRTGLRFVNVFDFPIANFAEVQNYFVSHISEQLKSMPFVDKCARSFLINEFIFDDIKLRQQTGLFNPDYPAIIKRNHFVIDLDAYINLPHQINDTTVHFKNLHKIIENQFEILITSKLRDEVLNGKS